MLTKAEYAKEENIKAGIRDMVATELLASYSKSGEIDMTQLLLNLSNMQGAKNIPMGATKLPITFQVDEYSVMILEDGTIIVGKEGEIPIIQATNISVEDLTIEVGKTLPLNITTEPDTITEGLTYTSSKESIATVGDDGKVTGIEAGETTITVTGQKSGISGSCKVTVKNPPITAGYLVDNVEIGDYINIGIDYTNQTHFESSLVDRNYNTSGMSGWRVLDKTGDGNTGTVKLISAGCPLSYYEPQLGTSSYSTSLSSLDNLYCQISIVSANKKGFVGNGFKDTNLKDIFDACTYIDTTKGVHTMSTTDLETIYNKLTGTSKSTEEIYNMRDASKGYYPLMMSSMKEINPNLNMKVIDLLTNGFSYYLGGGTGISGGLWYVRPDGYVYFMYKAADGTEGIRPVVTLKSGIEISSENTGDGNSETSAIKIQL